MAVSKRLRFEILRRDNYTCHYCGASAPDVKLHVDHVIPVSTGGQDAPENLVTACKDCNTGKSSATPDASTVAQVGAAATAYMLALQDGFTRLREMYWQEDEYIGAFEELWNSWTRAGKHIPRPTHWKQSIRRWHRIGVPIDLVEDAIEIAMKKDLTRASSCGEFQYMAGVIWRTLDELGSVETVTPETVHVYTEAEKVDLVCDAYEQGWRAALAPVEGDA